MVQRVFLNASTNPLVGAWYNGSDFFLYDTQRIIYTSHALEGLTSIGRKWSLG